VDERGTVKVADFGLSRELLLRDYYRSDGSGMTPVPVRWLAPESLEASVFTTMSDVVRLECHHLIISTTNNKGYRLIAIFLVISSLLPATYRR